MRLLFGQSRNGVDQFASAPARHQIIIGRLGLSNALQNAVSVHFTIVEKSDLELQDVFGIKANAPTAQASMANTGDATGASHGFDLRLIDCLYQP